MIVGATEAIANEGSRGRRAAVSEVLQHSRVA